MASVQATEVIEHIPGIGKSLTGRLVIHGCLSIRINGLEVRKEPKWPHCGTPKVGQ